MDYIALHNKRWLVPKYKYQEDIEMNEDKDDNCQKVMGKFSLLGKYPEKALLVATQIDIYKDYKESRWLGEESR